jgi:hypothetical protein
MDCYEYIGCGLEGSDCALIEMMECYIPVGTDENQE